MHTQANIWTDRRLEADISEKSTSENIIINIPKGILESRWHYTHRTSIGQYRKETENMKINRSWKSLRYPRLSYCTPGSEKENMLQKCDVV